MSERILPERANDEIRRLRKQLDALLFGSSKLRSASIGEGGLRLRDGGSLRVDGGRIVVTNGDGATETFATTAEGLDLLGLLRVAGGIEVDGGEIVIRDTEGAEAMRLASDGLTLEGALSALGSIDLQGLLSVTGDIDVNDGGTITIRDSGDDVQFEVGTDGLTLSGILSLVADGRLSARDGGDNVRLEWGNIPIDGVPRHRLVTRDASGGHRAIVGEGLTKDDQLVHGITLQSADDFVFVVDDVQFVVYHGNGQDALWVFNNIVGIQRADGSYSFFGNSTTAAMESPDGNKAVYVTNSGVEVFGDFDVTGGTKNAAIEADDGNTYRFGADESPHAGRLIYDFDVTVTDGQAEVDLPVSLGLIAKGAWVRGPWPQGHPGGNHYATLDGDRLIVHGADGRYMVEVVAYRSDPAAERWTHVSPTVVDEDVIVAGGSTSPRSRGRPARRPAEKPTGRPNR